MEEFPSNSKTTGKVVMKKGATQAKHEEPQKPKVEKIVSGPVIQRKTPLGRRFKETFFGGNASEAGHHVVENVLVPAMRDMIFDAITSAAEGIIFKATGGRYTGAARSASRLVNNASQSFVQYNRFGGNSTPAMRPDPRNDPRPQLSREARRVHDFREIVLATRAEANEVIMRMNDLINRYDTCSVSDLYSMLGIDPDFTDENWGWDNLQHAGIHRERNGGYSLALPQPEPLA